MLRSKALNIVYKQSQFQLIVPPQRFKSYKSLFNIAKLLAPNQSYAAFKNTISNVGIHFLEIFTYF